MTQDWSLVKFAIHMRSCKCGASAGQRCNDRDGGTHQSRIDGARTGWHDRLVRLRRAVQP